jgi:hypothetical protein
MALPLRIRLNRTGDFLPGIFWSPHKWLRKKSQEKGPVVIPAQAGIQSFQLVMDSRLRGSDGLEAFYDSPSI